MTKMQSAELEALLTGQAEPITQLLQASYPIITNTNKKSYLDTQTLIDLLSNTELNSTQTLLDAINLQAKVTITLSPQNQAIFFFCDQLFNEYCKLGPLHQDIKCVLHSLKKPMAATMLIHQQWPWQTLPDLSALLQSTHCHCIGWSPELGRASARFLATLKSLIAELAIAYNNDTFTSVSNTLDDFFLTEAKRTQKLENRLHDAETGTLQARHAYKESARILNQLMAGKKLPNPISNFLQGPLHQSLQLMIINKGQDSLAYQHCIALIETLIRSFQPLSNDEQERQYVYQSISQIADKLRDNVISLQHDSTLLESQLSVVEAHHLQILKGCALDYQPFELIDNADPLSSAQTVISSALLRQVNLLDEGQWFCYQDVNSPHIKLSLKQNDAKQLLFTHFFGVKAACFSFEEFAYTLSSKQVKPVSLKDHFKLTGEILVNTLYESYQNKKQQQTAVYAEKQLKLKRKIQAQEAARKAALEEAKQLAIAQQQTRLEAENTARQAEKDRRKHAAQQGQQGKLITDINRLQIGGLVEFYDEMGQCKQLKLAVKLQSSGKYVFTDHTGIKRQELLRDELAEKLREGSAKIINVGSYFEDSLEKVVNGLRKGRKE